jgi:hydroxymethylbilane synthase
VKIGTRGSALALAQAGSVADALGGEIVVIKTSGDRDHAAGDKGRWVAEIERALLDEEIDLAVHSAKDVPAELAEGLTLLPPPARADPRDAICGASGLSDVNEGGRVGTSSLRRRAQLLALRPDLDVVDLRGNVDTRLRRLAEGDFDAIVVAYAGLQRLGLTEEGAPLDELVPAAGQGTLALEARADDEPTRRWATKLADGESNVAQQAERALVRALDADCDTPVGAHAIPADGGLRLRAFVGRPDGSAWLTDELTGTDPVALGEEVAERLLKAGAAEVLGR